MAPPTKPLELKMAQGNPGKRALPKPVVMSARSTPVPRAPKTLGTVGRATWKLVFTHAHQWVHDDLDRALVHRYCQLTEEVAQMVATLETDGPLVHLEDGSVHSHPYLKLIGAARRDLTKWEGLLGLTPSDRTKLNVQQVKGATALDRFINK